MGKLQRVRIFSHTSMMCLLLLCKAERRRADCTSGRCSIPSVIYNWNTTVAHCAALPNSGGDADRCVQDITCV